MVDQLANDYASQPVVFLEYNDSSAPPKRYNRWWAAFGGSTAYYPMVMITSGHQVGSGYTADLYNTYKGMVDAELARAPLADFEAYSWRVDNHVKFSGQMTNRSGQTLSTARNDATLHALVYEDAHIGVTNRYVRAAVYQAISADLLSGSSISFDLETPDLTGVNWTNLHMLVLADYRPNGSSGAYDMLQAARADIACTYTISPSNYNFSSSSGTGGITVAASPSSCSWTATSNNSWITITSGGGGSGNGTVGYSVAANSGFTRTGTITIGGRSFTITQASANTDFDTVQKIYIGYYQRPADPAGLIYWAGILDSSGGNLNGIIEAFANSAESQALYGTINSSNISNVVKGLYNALVARDAEPAGLAYWVGEFNSGRITAASIMLNILNGAQNEDLQAVNNKLTAANLFTRTIDPEFDGSNFQATYAGDGDVIAGRNFLAFVTSNTATVPTQSQTTEYIRANIANPGDVILTP